MKFKNKAFSASEGQIIAYATVIISLITIMSYYIPGFAAMLNKLFIISGTVLFGIPYVLFILYVIYKSIQDVLEAINSEIKLDFKEIGSDLREIFLGDRDKKILPDKEKREKSLEEKVAPEMFEDLDDRK